MAPFDWKSFMKLSPDQLKENDELQDKWFDKLSDFDINGETDLKRVQHLAENLQAMMMIKHTEAEMAIEEVQETAAEEGKKISKKDERITNLEMEVTRLKHENRELKPRAGDSSARDVGPDAKYMRDEIRELDNLNQSLNEKIKQLDRQLQEEKMLNQRLAGLKDEAEVAMREMKAERDEYRDEFSDLQKQMNAQRDSMVMSRDATDDHVAKMRKKNQILNEALEENKNLTMQNEKLEEEIAELKRELRDGKHEMEKTTDEYLKLKNIVGNADSVQEKLRRENEMLKDQNDQLVMRVKTRSETDDEVMVQLNKKVEEWKMLLGDKEEELDRARKMIEEQRELLARQDMDSEKTSIAALTKALQQRDERIDELKQRLEEAVGDMEANKELMENVQGELGKTTRGDRQTQKISQLQGTLKVVDGHMKDAETRAAQAEDDARQKDKELNEAFEKIQKMEAGVYGLPEAVAEIKEHKMQIKIRDKQVEELTQYINRCEEQINDLQDESEDLRERLGLDPKEPLDMGEFKKRKTVRQQQDRALNRILQKEVEGLEEERTELKLQIRKLAQATGQRAVALGLSADDMLDVDNYIVEIKEKKLSATSAMSIRSRSEAEELKIRQKQAEKEVEKTEQKLQRVTKENAEMKAQNKELMQENKDFEKGMKEIQQAIKEQAGSGGGEPLHCPTLDRMLAAIDAKSLTGRYDAALYLKAQVDNLTGHNEELRKELRETRFEATKAHVAMEKAQSKAVTLEAEVKQLKDVGAGGFFQTMPLPEGMAVTSADVINSLNEHLTHALQELHLKEDMLQKMEISLETYRRKFAVMRHQQGLLYQDYFKDKQVWDENEKKLQADLKEAYGKSQEDKARMMEFDRLVDTLAQDEPEVRRRLAELTRTVTTLRVNEAALTRRYTALAESAGDAQKQITKLQKDAINMQAAVQSRIGYLQRHKDTATFQIASLQRNLDESVPAREMDELTKQFIELTEKYRDLLEQSNTLVAHKEQTSAYELESKRLSQENNEIIKELGIEKEKLHVLEAAFENMRKEGKASSTQLTDDDVLSLAAKLTRLEMKELNERQRANNASSLYEKIVIERRQLEDRNFELEAKFAELHRTTVEMEKTERHLRDELANCVTKVVSDADRTKIIKLEKNEHDLSMEVSKLKEIAEVANMQVRAMNQQQTARDKEVTSLRQQLLDFQAESDDKTVIGKLHRHIVQLQVSEGEAMRQLQDSKARITHLEATQLRTEQRLDDKDTTIYHNRLEARSKTRHLKQTVQELRRKFAGAVPLPQQEKFSKQMMNLQNDKLKIEDELRQTNDERAVVEGRLEELKVQHEGLQELIATLKDRHGAKKVMEWQAKMEAVRLEDLRLKRDMDKVKNQLRFQEGLIKRHEVEVLSLEEDKVRQAREFEQRELDWERREADLERTIANMERAQAEIADAASEFEEATSMLPDSSLPVPQQLASAVTIIKANTKTIYDAKAEVAHIKKRLEEVTTELKEREKEVVKRDRLITEMRLRMPADPRRDEIIRKAQETSTMSTPGKHRTVGDEEDYETEQAVRVAQATVASLQKRLAVKEESIHKLKAQLEAARTDQTEQNEQHREQLQMLQDKLHAKNDDQLSKFARSVKDSILRPSANVPSNEQLRKLNEFEDIVADQDNSLSALQEKLRQTRQELAAWKQRHDQTINTHQHDKERMLEEQHSSMMKLEERLSATQLQVQEKESLLKLTQEELERQKEANARAPSTVLKNALESKKHDVALKENQLKKLTSVVSVLKQENMGMAETLVTMQGGKNRDEINVQKLVDKQTKHLQDRIEELEQQVTKLRVAVKKAREDSESSDAEELRRNLSKKETKLRKLQDSNTQLENQVEELEAKVQRMSTMAKQKTVVEPVVRELEELKSSKRRLEEELRKYKHQAERPYEQVAQRPTSSSTNNNNMTNTEMQVAKWEENKKYQQMVDRLKARIKTKSDDVEKLTKANESLKNALERLTKEKETADAKLRKALHQGLERPIEAQHVASTFSAAPPSHSVHSMQEIKARNHELEDQLSELKRQLALGRDKTMEDLQMRNRLLSEKLQQLESQFSQQRGMSASQDGGETTAAFRSLANKEQELQKKMLQLSDENISLRFEVEAAKKDVPRLKERIAEQQKYIEILKQEKEQLQEVRSARSHSSLGSLGSITSNVRRIGEGGKTPKEMEMMIKKLGHKLKTIMTENEQLKNSPNVVLPQQLANMQIENARLKDQLSEVQSKMGASLSERYESKQEGTAKVMASHDKTRKELLKEQEKNEKLRVKVNQQESRIKQLQAAVEAAQTESTHAAPVDPKRNSADAREFRAMKTARAAEDKLAILQQDLDKKTQMLSDVTILLREAAEREQHLLKENEGLEKKLNILKQFPPGSKNVADKELVENYQMLRLTVERLENEKRELLHELQSLRKMRNSSAGGPHDVGEDEILDKLGSYDKVMRDNVDVNTQLKAAHLAMAKLKQQNQELQKELTSFGPEFFDEIEDLKLMYRESQSKNEAYEQQLKQFSQQFGFQVNLPAHMATTSTS